MIVVLAAFTLTPVPAVPPKLTLVPPNGAKFVPVMVTVVPPPMAPLDGLMFVIVGVP